MELREFSPTDGDLLRKIGRLRVRAWETETAKAAEMKIWLDEFDASARHWAVFHDGVPVASARLSVHTDMNVVPDAETYAGVFPEVPPAPMPISR
jgi:hypothetical protein